MTESTLTDEEKALAALRKAEAEKAAKLRSALETYFLQDEGRFGRLERLMQARGLGMDELCLSLVQSSAGMDAPNEAAWVCASAQALVIRCGGVPSAKDHERLTAAREANAGPLEAIPAGTKKERKGGQRDAAPVVAG